VPARARRTSLYQNPEYLKVAPFAKLTLAFDRRLPIRTSRPVQPVPYVWGCNMRLFRNFRAIGHPPSAQQFSAGPIPGSSDRSDAAARSRAIVDRTRK